MKLKLLLLFVTLATFSVALNALTPGGRNVCSKNVAYTVYRSVSDLRVGYENYRACCRRFLGRCSSRCTKTRSKMVTYYKQVAETAYRPNYFCCAGWAPAGAECTKPICNPPCRNGRCTSPGVCTCNTGFNGNRCENDINECIAKPCSQICDNLPGTYNCACRVGYKKISSDPKSPTCSDVDECTTKPCTCLGAAKSCVATCANNPGSYSCSCNAGYTLEGAKVCKDINECAVASLNGCQQNCNNNNGGFFCSCNAGYVLAADKKACNDVDECAKLNGGCQQNCINSVGAYKCTCKVGFRINSSNKLKCDEIDECKEGIPCDAAQGICTNTRGSYKCSCKIGYALQSDGKTCVDIDECARNDTNSCQHFCHNSIGSYTCSCKIGFRLDTNQRACNDIDECKEGSNQCDHRCHNNVGSYSCSCRPGYILETDGLICRALPCVDIKAPQFGSMNCSGLVTDEHCYFGCDPGYNLLGSNKRLCLPSTAWNGETTVCEPKICPEFIAPNHGSVLIPCREFYTSKCFITCKNGFYLEGQGSAICVLREGITAWTGKNNTCEANKACTPNPCGHNGQCIESGIQEFKCNCRGTGYEGDRCEVGLIQISSIPRLEVGKQSEMIKITASPDINIKITFMAKDETSLTFNPSTVTIAYPLNTAEVSVSASKAGSSEFSVIVTGPSASNFKQPAAKVVYSFIKRPESKPLFMNLASLTSGCQSTSSRTCPTGSTLLLTSTCQWNRGSAGFIETKSSTQSIPLSPFGLSGTASNLITSGFINPIREVQDYLTKQIVSSCTSPSLCTGSIPLNLDVADYIADNNMFVRARYSAFNKELPVGLSLQHQNDAASYAPDSLKSVFGSGVQLKSSGICKDIEYNSDHFYNVYSPKSSSVLSVHESKKTIGDQDSVCISNDLCDRSTMFSLPVDKAISFTNELSSLGLGNVKLSLSKFGINGKAKKKCARVVMQPFPEACVSAMTSIDVVASLNTSDKAKVTIEGNVDVEHSDFKQIFVKQFDANNKMLVQGNANCELDMDILGKRLTFKTHGDNNAAYINIGGYPIGNSSTEKKGVFIATNQNKVKISFPSGSLRFIPSSGNIYTYLPYDVTGRQITGIENTKSIQLQLRLLSKFEIQVMSLKAMLSSKYSADYDVILSHTQVFSKFVTKLNDVIVNLTAVDGFVRAQSEMTNLKQSAHDVKSGVRSLTNRLGSDPVSIAIRSRIRFIDQRLNQLLDLDIKPSYTSIHTQSGSNVVSYFGSICFHKLCLEKSHISVTAGDPTKASKPKIEIQPSEDLILSDSMSIGREEKIQFELESNSFQYTSTFKTVLRLFGSSYQGIIAINNNEVSVTTKDVILANLLNFTMKASAALDSATWDGFLNNVEGVANKNGSAVSMLKQKAQSWFQEKSESALLRVERATNLSLSGQQELKNQNDEVVNAKLKLAEATKQSKTAQLLYRRQLVLLNRSQIELASILPQIDELFIQRQLDGVCKLTTCSKICKPFTTCKICQDPVYKTVDVMKCIQVPEKITSSQLLPYQTSCTVQKVIFQTVYTGSCPESEHIKTKREKELEQNLIATGAAIGTSIGTMVGGPFGALIGSVIGAAIGWISSFFKSCDTSYEVYEKRFFVQEPCTQLEVKPLIIERIISECDTVKKTVKTGYDNPKECDCQFQSCFAEVSNPTCVKANNECQKNRQTFLQGSTAIPDKFTVTYTKIQQLKINLKVAQVKAQQSEQERSFLQGELERQKIFLDTKKQESAISKQKASNLDSVLGVDKCLLQFFKKSQSLFDHLNIIDLTFQTALPILGSFQLDAKLDLTGSTSLTSTPLRIDINDVELSLKASAKRIVTSSLCPTSRRRRRSTSDINEIEDNDAFTSWYSEAAVNATNSQHSCITFLKITTFLESLSKGLHNASKEIEVVSQLVAASTSTFPILSFGFSDTNKEVVVEAEQNLIGSIDESLATLAARSNPSDAIALWKQRSEIFTNSNNYTSCLGFADCTENAFDSLRNLPSMLRTGRANYIKLVSDTENLFNSVSISMDFRQLEKTSQSLLRYIEKLHHMSLHCSKPPKASINPKQNITLQESETLSLNCIAQSDLPVYGYVWRHHNTPFKTTTDSSITIKVTSSHDGVYSCEAISSAGKRESDGVNVIVHARAVFRSQPTDFDLILPKETDFDTIFLCNVTGKPTPEINWYHIRFNSTSESGEPIIGEDGKQLNIKSSSLSNAGFYYCTANNSVGPMVTSRKARLNILNRELNMQSLSYCINVTSRDNINQEKFLDLTSVLQKNSNQVVEVSFTKYSNFSGKLCGDTRVRPSTSPGDKPEQFVLKASSTRQGMAQTLANLLVIVSVNQSQLKADSGISLDAVNDSLIYNFRGNGTRSGFILQSNGISSVECPLGTFEKESKCVDCPPNTYQDKTGSNNCTECPTGKITEGIAATSLNHCIEPRQAEMSIVFVMETTRSLMWDWIPANNLIIEFVSKLPDLKQVKIAVIRYNSYPDVIIRLGELTDAHKIKVKLQESPNFVGTSRTSEAIEEATSLLKTSKDEKKFIIVISSGYNGRRDGFDKARQAAIHAKQENITLISVANGKRFDKQGLFAIASYPKHNYYVRLDGNPALTAKGVYDVISRTFQDECYHPLADIAVIVGPTHQCIPRPHSRPLGRKLAEMITKISGEISSDTAVGMFGLNSRLQRKFEQVKSLSTTQWLLQRLLSGRSGGIWGYRQSSQSRGHGRGGRGKGSGNRHGRGHGKHHNQRSLEILVEDVYNKYYNEKMNAIGKFKTAIIISCQATDYHQLFDFDRTFPNENILPINIALDGRELNIKSNFTFTMSQVDDIIEFLKEKHVKERLCNRS